MAGRTSAVRARASASRGQWTRSAAGGCGQAPERAGSRGRRGWPGGGGRVPRRGRGGGEGGRAGLRQGHEMRRGLMGGRGLDRGRHLVVEAERAGRERHQAGVDPVGDHDLAQRQQRGEQRAEDRSGIARMRGEQDEAAGRAGGRRRRTSRTNGVATISSARTGNGASRATASSTGRGAHGAGGERAGQELAGTGRGSGPGACRRWRGARSPATPRAGALPFEPGIEHRPG